MIACGLDFGTSNSAIGIVRGDDVALAPLEDDETLIPSAVLFDCEAHRVLFGSDAIAAYVGQTEGRLMRALKTIPGSALMDEKTSLGGRVVPLAEVVGIFRLVPPTVSVIAPFSTIALTSNGWLCSGVVLAPGVRP